MESIARMAILRDMVEMLWCTVMVVGFYACLIVFTVVPAKKKN